MRILKERSIGLVIDIQEKLFPYISNNTEFLVNVKKLIEGLQILEVPVLITEQYKKGLGATHPDISSLLSNSEPLEKLSFSCCDDEIIFNKLQEQRKSSVIICGIESHICVLQTSIDLIEKGLTPIIVEDCVSSRNLKDKDIAIKRLRMEGAIITSAESILFELCRYAGTDQFKAISKLIK